MIKFSVIIPVLNVENYIEKCLNSLLKQTYNNFEAIIVCDKCTDKSEKIVDKYVEKNKNFKKIYAEKTGLAKAKNLGIEQVKGEYILFLDGDDFFEGDLLDTLNRELNADIEVLRFQAREISKKNSIDYNEEAFDAVEGNKAFAKIIKYHYIENSWLYVYKSTFWKENNFKFYEGCIAEDYGLTPLIISKAQKVKSISYIGYNYVQRDNSLMNNDDYSNKIQKMEDMLVQAERMKSDIDNTESNSSFHIFINNSLIYYSTTLKKRDYVKYNRILKKKKYFNHLKNNGIKSMIKNALIKNNSWFFYHYIAR